MQGLSLALLLILSATAEPSGPRPEAEANETELRRQAAIAGLRARQGMLQESLRADPCAAAREIVRQPPCLAGGDCEALQLWRRSFGSPRMEPLDPERAVHRSAATTFGPRRRLADGLRSPLGPGRQLRVGPSFVCPAGGDPPD